MTVQRLFAYRNCIGEYLKTNFVQEFQGVEITILSCRACYCVHEESINCPTDNSSRPREARFHVIPTSLLPISALWTHWTRCIEEVALYLACHLHRSIGYFQWKQRWFHGSETTADLRTFFVNVIHVGIHLYVCLYFPIYFQVLVKCFKRTNLNENSPLTAASVLAYRKKGNGRETQTPQLIVRYYLPHAIFGIDDFISFVTGSRLNALIPFIHSK